MGGGGRGGLNISFDLSKIVGPLLFLIYINDLPNCLLNSLPRMYADDTHLTFAAKTISNIDSNLN